MIGTARTALTEAGLAIELAADIDSTSYMLIGHVGESDFSEGEYVRIIVTGTGANLTDVRVLTRKRLATNIFAKADYAPQIFSLIDSRLKIEEH